MDRMFRTILHRCLVLSSLIYCHIRMGIDQEMYVRLMIYPISIPYIWLIFKQELDCYWFGNVKCTGCTISKHLHGLMRATTISNAYDHHHSSPNGNKKAVTTSKLSVFFYHVNLLQSYLCFCGRKSSHIECCRWEGTGQKCLEPWVGHVGISELVLAVFCQNLRLNLI